LFVWRPRYIREDGEELEILEAEVRIISQVYHLLHGHRAKANLGQAFRAGDRSFNNLTNVLCLSLDDFATDKISTNIHFGDSTKVDVSYKKLAQFLNRAEEMQESQGPTQGSGAQSIKSKRQTRKRKRSSTSFDQLSSEDKAERQNQEAKTEERIDAAYDDFTGTLVETYGQQPRLSTRQKVGESLSIGCTIPDL
jgi:hypothetical protein